MRGASAFAFATMAISTVIFPSCCAEKNFPVVPIARTSPAISRSTKSLQKILALRAGSDTDPTSLISSASFSTIASVINTFYRTSPLLAAFLTCGANASAADIVAQKRASIVAADPNNENKHCRPIEKRRTLAFLLYGGLYQGVAQEFLYNRFLPKLFGVGTAPPAVIGKVLFDMLVLTPFLCLPVAYLVKSMVYQRPLSDAWERYSYDVREAGLLKKFWCLWGPVQCLTFGIVPEHFRVSFVSSVSFFWLIVLSTISSGKSD
uniref:Uncharacterized protein n=1 Tax=Odontella aurita TaxID=265563 RepID=A0A7S4MGE0_9STRA